MIRDGLLNDGLHPMRTTYLIQATGLCLTIAGCATMDPSQDYDRAARRAAQATGIETAYRPDDDASIQSRVTALLADELTLDEAVEISLLNNPGFQAAWMSIGMAKADLVQSGLLSNPSLGGSLRLPAGGGLANLEVAIAQNIADLWQIPIRQKVAGAVLDREILDLARQASELASDTRAAYFQFVGRGQLFDIAGENLTVSRQLLDVVIERQKAGAGSELETNLARSAVLEAELTVESARLEAADARRALARLLGLTTDPQDLVLADALPQSPPAGLQADRLIDLARAKRPDVHAAARQVAEAEARVREEWLGIFPLVEVGVALERGERRRQEGRDILADTARASIANGQLTAPEIEPRSERRQNTDFIIGPSWNLELPLFDQNQAQIAKAGYAYQEAVKALDNLERLLAQDVRGAVDRLQTAWRIAGHYRDRFIPLADRNLSLSRESYQAGRASFLSVLEAQRFYLDTRRRAIEAMNDASAAIPELERVVGLPLREIEKTGD